MATFRRIRKYQDGPPAWTQPTGLGRAGWPPIKVEWHGELSPLLGRSGTVDNRGLLLTTEAKMHQKSGYVLRWVGEMLGLEHTEGWRTRPPESRFRPPPFLRRLVRDFYDEAGHAIAWVMVESCRDSIRQRHRGFKEALLPSTKPDFQFVTTGIEDRVKIPLSYSIDLSTDGLVMMLPQGRTARDTHFTRMAVQRTLKTETDAVMLTGQWMNWCLASRETDQEALSRGSAPASGQGLLPGYVNPARLMTWMKLDLRYPAAWTYSYAVDIDVTSGRVFSVRYARVPLRMQIELDPWLDDWLLTAIHSF